MNERIKLLAEQAGMGPWGVGNDDNVSEIVEKFAELIVRECAGRVDHILRERQAGGGTMGDVILEHFGVEE